MRNLKTKLMQCFTKALAINFIFLLVPSIIFAQPADLPWDTDPDCESIITTGIVAVSCGVLQQSPPAENFTFGMMDLNGALPAAGRIDVTASVDMYHHPSWLIDSIGNVFGITMDNCGNTYTTASSQYSSAYLGIQGIVRYGEIGGGTDDLSAAGTVYKIDGTTGQASVFSVLPQQAYTFNNTSCEGGSSSGDRNTGPSLGNIIFSFSNKIFYVTNFEDGRIYRIDTDGNILDSFDPGTYDDGQPGHPSFSDLPYGLDINNDDSQLFFGTMGENGTDDAKLYSINLQPDGSFPGSIDNTNLPVGATWDNYVDSLLTFHFEFPDVSGFGNNMTFVSDLEFAPNGNLLVGNRTGCSSSLHTSYNHGGRSWIIEPDGGGIYNIATVIYASNGSISNDNAYGGVSVFENPNGTTEYVISSADMLSEQGPHGICTQEEGVYGTPGSPASPSGIIAYLPGGIPNDVKGIGGDVHVFKECACTVTYPDSIEANDLYVCSGEPFNLSYSLISGNADLIATWTDPIGNVINPDSIILTNTACEPGQVTFYLSAICLEDSTQTYVDTAIVTILTDDISPYVTGTSDDCSVDVMIDPNCVDYLTILDTIPIINPGDSGTVCIDVIQNAPITCDTFTICLDYDCPCDSSCCPEAIEAMPLTVCSNEPFDLTFEVINGISNLDVTWTDEMGVPIDPNGYSIVHSACAPGGYTFYVSAICEDDINLILMDTVVITVITDDISPFVTTIEEPCEIDVIIDQDCLDYLAIIGTLPDVNPGDSGTACVTVVQTTPISCDTMEICLDYDCPCDASCCPTELEVNPITICNGDIFDLEVVVIGGQSDVEIIWTDDGGNVVNPNDITGSNTDCAPATFNYNVEVICEADTSVILTATIMVTVITDDISPFVTVIEDPCFIDVIIDPNCVDYIDVIGTIPTINPGESGTVVLDVVQTTAISCTNIPLTLNYDCPCDESCCPTDITTTPLDLCSGDVFDLEVAVNGGTSDVDIEWTDINGNIIDPVGLIINHTDCVTGEYSYIVEVTCVEFPSVVLIDTVTMTVVTTDISPFVTLVQEDCNIDVIIDPDCLEYLQIDGTIPTINPGDSGTVMIDIIQINSISCEVYTVELSFDCECIMSNVVAIQQPCDADGTFEVQVNLDVVNSGNTFTIYDENGDPVDTYNYSDLPITLGPFAGDSTTVWNYTVSDDLDPTCNGQFAFGPVSCPICGDCEIPNAFTPDADGVNDEFTVICFGFANVTEFQIYNRWGEKVHDAVEPWRGMYKGKPAPSDVYIFRIVYDNSCELTEYTGDVTLIR